jgi:heme-degrading monooxygenase HmoA
MREFHDCLKHKVAYVAVGEFKPGRFADAQRLYEKAVSTYTDGFKGAYLLQKTGTDEGIAVIMWDQIDDMQANQSEDYQAIMKELNSLFASPPTTSYYEVCSEIKGE